MNSIEFPLLDRTTQNSVISTTLNDLSNWSRLSSLWPLLYGTSCCFIEFASLIGSRFDFDRYGLVPRSSPRQADLILTAGTQMPEPKYVIAMGACTITGGMFSTDSYSTVRGVDKLIPVDENRCFTTNHKFHVERSTHTGNYNQGFFYQPPFTSEITSDIFFQI
ncbi:hypothetical protein AAHE18_11G121000 [Arachis hypogaea]